MERASPRRPLAPGAAVDHPRPTVVCCERRPRRSAMSSLAPQRNEALVIRRAKPVDAAEIARVQVQSWREAYAGIIPQPYLDRLSVPAHERHWRQSLGGGEWAFVAEWERRIVGFANGGLSRVRRDITGGLWVRCVRGACGGGGAGGGVWGGCRGGV